MNEQELTKFYAWLVNRNYVDLTDIVEERGGVQTLIRDFAGLSANTAFQSPQDMITRIGTALVREYQATGGSHLKAAV